MKGNPYKAFTLVELMMSIAIMGIMSAILLFNYPDSNVKIKMVNFTQTIALLLREAQIKGSAVSSGAGQYAGYGVYFNRASSSQVVLFADETIPGNYKNGILIGDGLFATSTPNNEIKSITTLPTGYYVSKICVTSGNTQYCNTDTNPEIDTLTISFIRPNQTPIITVNDNPIDTLVTVLGSVPIPLPYSKACIELSSPKAPTPGHIRSINIEGVGYISTKVSSCQ